MLLPTLRNAPVANSANAESISVSVISATRCERRFRTFFFLKKVNIRKRFRNPAHRSKFKLYRPLGYIIIPKILTHIQQSNQIRMNFPAGIIPVRAFLQFRINFPGGNHPCEKNHVNKDEFPSRKSSIQNISCKSGCYDSFQMPQAIPTFPPARRKSFILLCREVSSRRFSSSADFCCPAASLYTHSR